MNKLILISTLFVFSITSCVAQTNSIFTKDLTVNNIEIYSLDKDILLQKLGNPLSITQEYFEMDNLYAQKYTYNGAVFYLTDGGVEIFKITNGNFNFSKYNIKVGDHISNIQNYYPISYNNRSANSIILMLSDMDASVVISYNYNNLITSINLIIH